MDSQARYSYSGRRNLIQLALCVYQQDELHRDSAGASERQTGTGRLCASLRKNN